MAQDLNGDGLLDLATANSTSNDVSVLLSRGGGVFAGPFHFVVGTNPVALISGDLNGDGRLDLATANSRSDDITLLAGRGDGSFADPVRLDAGDYPVALTAADFNDDGRSDLALATHLAGDVSIFPGLGDGTFLAPGALSVAIRAAPLVMDWNRDGTDDVVVIDGGGEVFLRLGRPATPGTFEAPIVLSAGGAGARDLAVVSTENGFVLAALNAFGSVLSFYSPTESGSTRMNGPVIPGTLPVRLVSGDLNGDGLGDLVVVAAGSSELFVYLGGKLGGFAATPDYLLRVGSIPSDVTLTDMDEDGRLDIVVTNLLSGDVSIFLNNPAAPFASGPRFRAGTGLSFVEMRSNTKEVRSADGANRVLAGNFDGDPLPEMIVLQSGANRFSVLDSNEIGGLLNPQSSRTFAAGLSPTYVVSARFNADPHLDLAVLTGNAEVLIYLGDGTGGFIEQPILDERGQVVRLSAGNQPSGLAVHDITGDGFLDLLVSNAFGDLLILPGKGDGTFRPYQRAERTIALAVADLNGDGKQDFVFANEALDRVSVEYGRAGWESFRIAMMACSLPARCGWRI